MFKKFFLIVGIFYFFGLSTLKTEAIGKKLVSLDPILEKSLQENRPKYVSDEVLIKFKKDKVNLENTGLLSFFRELNTSYSNNLKKDDVLKAGNIVVYKINDGRSVEEVIEEVKKDANVETAQPNYYSYVSALGTNDVEKNKLWGLDNTGQTITKDSGVTTVGTVDADIDMPEAWAVSTGTDDVIVAVIDTGVNYNHPDLINNMWDGSNCVNESGYAIPGGCLYGYDFENNDNNPLPGQNTDETHGTHVSGTIAAANNNSVGVASVGGYKVKIMALKFGFDTASAIKAIDFAIQNGAKVINASYGGSSFSSLEYDAINRFKTAGGLLVAAAGNGGADNRGDNNEIVHNYPSDYDLDNIISVAATNNKDELANFSNYGAISVDVGAPGVDILSTVNYKQDYYEDFLNLIADVGSSWFFSISDGTTLMWADESIPYLNNMDYHITSATINLSGLTTVTTDFSFMAFCDDLGTTAAGGAANGDYMALEVSGDGTSFTEISKWNEASITAMESSGVSGNFHYSFFNVNIGNSYLTSNFKYRLHWVTDGSLSTNNGCFIRDIKIIDYNGATAGYDYKNGTSMAAPQVAGLAGYLLSVDPTATYSEIRSNILTNGDTLPSLNGKTTTGKRINAFNSVSVMTPEVSTVPGAPTGVGATSGDTQITLRWTAPANNGGASIIDYSIYSTNTVTGVTAVNTATGTTKVFTGLTNDQQYSFYVAARNSVGIGATSATVTATPAVPTIPGIPTGVGATAGNSQITLRWTAPANNGGASIIDYQVEYKLNSGVGWTIFSDGVSTGTTAVVTGLTNNISYDFRISAQNSVGIGATSATVTATPAVLGPITIGSTAIGQLLDDGIFEIPAGNLETGTSKVVVKNDVIINVGESSPSIYLIFATINLENQTEITKEDATPFDATLISATIMDKIGVSGLASGFSAKNLMQWGIPGVTLNFSNPVLISMYVGSEYNGQTLSILRSPSTSSGWTSEGLVSSTCLIVNNACTFSTNKASYFTVVNYQAPVVSNNLSNSSNNSSSNNSSAGNSYVCNDETPTKIPDLFELRSTKGTAKLFYTPSSRATTYAVLYGFKKGDERFGTIVGTNNGNKGVQNADILALNPKSTYYFKVAAINGCTIGPWSEWAPIKADRKKTVYRYKTIIKKGIKQLMDQFLK